MQYILPLSSQETARWTCKYDLGNERYTFYFSWNTRGSFWEMSIYDRNEKLLVGGIRLVKYISLLDEYTDTVPGLPTGRLMLLPANDVVIDITRDNLDTDFILCYIEGELDGV